MKVRLLSPEARARFVANRAAMLGLGLCLGLCAFAVFGPWLIGADPNASDWSLPRSAIGGPPSPSLSHPLGADPLWRDLLARLCAGARLSLGIAASATAMAVSLGAAVGIVAGLCEGTQLSAVDALAMRLCDLLLAFPYLLLVVAIGVAVDRQDAVAVALVLGLTGWVGLARLVRAKTMQHKRRDYILAARALGAGRARLVARHLLPGLAGTLLAVGSLSAAQMILAEAVLGYLGVGVPPPRASWGRMLQEVEHYLGAQPLLCAAPAAAMVLAVLGFARVGDGLSEAIEGKAPAARSRLPADALVLVLVFASLAAFSGREPLPAPLARPAHPAGELHLATSVAVRTLDPALASDEPSRVIGGLIYARLVGWDERGQLRGELAERFALQDGGRRVRLWLRPGLTFHDGSPLGAGDVKRSIERALNPGTTCPSASAYAGLVGFDAFRDGRAAHLSGIAVASPLEVVFSLAAPDASFAAVLGLPPAAPVCASGGDRASAGRPPPCGAGPFRLTAFDHERVLLDRFEGYFGGAPRIRRVDWQLGVPARLQRYRFERGELDALAELTGIDTERFAADPRWHDQHSWLARPMVFGVFLNTRMAPFSDRHLRRAAAFALDPSVLPVMRPSLMAIDRVLPAGIGRPIHAAGRRFDREAALDEMRLAGYPFDPRTGAGGYPEPIDYWTTPGSLDESAAQIYQQQLAKVGLRIRLRLVSYAAFLAAIATPQTAQMGWFSWQPDFPDPAAVIDPTLTSAAIGRQGTTNPSFFSDPELDRLARAAHREADEARRMALYARIERIVADEAPWIPTYTSLLLVLWQPYLRAFAPDAVDPWPLERAFIEEGR